MIGCSKEEAEKKFEAFWAGNKGVKDLIDYLEKFYRKNKYIVGLDGRKLHIRQKHMLLNTLVQSSAAIIFKRWSLIGQEKLDKELEYCRPMMSFHDEIQYRVFQTESDRAAVIVKDSAKKAGEYYNLKTEVAAEAKISTDWSGTH
jgi:DNA polymerase I-like protein with 3'-5' exonuclease and polymerase domains